MWGKGGGREGEGRGREGEEAEEGLYFYLQKAFEFPS